MPLRSRVRVAKPEKYPGSLSRETARSCTPTYEYVPRPTNARRLTDEKINGTWQSGMKALQGRMERGKTVKKAVRRDIREKCKLRDASWIDVGKCIDK